jgi:hypothetical protein
LQSIDKDSIIDDKSALAFFQQLVTSVDKDDVPEFVSQVPNVKSFFDKQEFKVQTKLKEQYEAEKSQIESTLAALKEQLPRDTDPEKIRQQIEIATDPTEKRLLQLELNNALANDELRKIKSEKSLIEKREQETALKNRLAEIAQKDGLPIHDPFIFAKFGEDAETVMRNYAEKNNAMIEERLKKMAADKFGGTLQKEGETQKTKMTLDEIENITDRKEQYAALKENGFIA